MAKFAPTIWLTEDEANALVLTKPFDAVPAFEQVDGAWRPTGDQAKDSNGLPVWASEALVGLGFNGQRAAIEIRVVGNTRPQAKIDGLRIARAYGAEIPAGVQAVAPAAKANQPQRPPVINANRAER